MTDTALRPYGPAFLEYATSRDEVVALAGDSSGGVNFDPFSAAFPNRFFNIGMAEQNMIGIAGGMARGGLVPFVHTFAAFLTRRPFDQIVMAVGYPKLRVRLVGGFPGVNPWGVSHQAIDDVALMRAIPGMTIVDVAEGTEIQTMLPTFDAVDGPIYCRIVGGAVPILFDSPFELGVARVVTKGADVALISSSISTRHALSASESLRRAGVSVYHLHVATLRPFDSAAVLQAIESTRAAIVVENHLTSGGLGSLVAELVADHGIGRRVLRLGLRDTYAGGGTEPYLAAKLGMDDAAIRNAVRDLLGLDESLIAGGASGHRPSESPASLMS